MEKIDFLIIGAGIVGIATALKLKEAFPSKEIIVLEKNSGCFLEASRYNSGVVHSGIHQQADLLKSKLARRGAPMLVNFCEKENVLHRKCGMIIAVSGKDLFWLRGDVKSLWLLYRNSRQQRISLEILTSRGIKKLEPSISAAFGIYLPDIWVIDQMSLGKKMFEKALKEGVRFIFNAGISSIERERNLYKLTVDRIYAADLVVNSAGVKADEVAAMAGFTGYRIFPYRGEYYEVIGPKKNLIKSTLVYPALRPGSPIKGVHFTKTVDGRLLIGPNASSWTKKEDDFSIQAPADEFLKAARKFLPDLKINDLRWAYSGLRAKINKGVGEEDFIIVRESQNPTFVNLIGIESPGFTAAFAIGEYVAEMIERPER